MSNDDNSSTEQTIDQTGGQRSKFKASVGQISAEDLCRMASKIKVENFADIPEDADTENVHDIERENHDHSNTRGEGYERPLSAQKRQPLVEMGVHMDPHTNQDIRGRGRPLRASVDSNQRRMQSADNCKRESSKLDEVRKSKNTTPSTIHVLDKVRQLNVRLAYCP